MAEERYEIVLSQTISGGWVAACVFGREAPDSPMAGGAAYGDGDTADTALSQVLDELGLPTRLAAAEAEAANKSEDYDRRGERLWRLAAKAGWTPNEGDNDATAAALPVIVAATLAPIEALHGPSGWSSICGCGEAKPCPTAQAIADIKAKAGA